MVLFVVQGVTDERLRRTGRQRFRRARSDGCVQITVRRKIGQLREAQEVGRLELVWDFAALLVFVDRFTMTWAGQTT
ncbi:hypothetical protein ACWGLG_32140 [Streptomyces antimycoticus]|nr:hypothetical protein [Streptomyces antimycoticus]